ncbi:ubiquinol-cytochrome C chaperone family protein [Rhizorhapis suberifaciens]|uniref:Cytochrome b pre-mRNA-processing protein 3 n=1 Tax=Rhizorhapis suberifaciens TaxID=13656 RepID=A0A840HV77_9SPHN|nr:ubiquinol-cytochrome C chaperone family protein [Rhizorhapis suberifaciens]MBB4641863.1 cytochrome b pre-mRNA-processing protein 3 [Rhizorhapis suberifaciens]
MSILSRLFAKADPREAMRPLYNAIVMRGREPHWYAQGGVPDTLDGRFDMIAAILSFLLLRLEGKADHKQESVWLTEIFVEDMDGQLREIGIGDVIVGKHIGKMMSALGGRLTAYRSAVRGGEGLEDVLARNLYRGNPPRAEAMSHVVEGLTAFWEALGFAPAEALLEGRLP